MKNVLLILVVSILSGCSSAYENSFGCGVDSGVRCASLSQVDELIDSGDLESAKTFCDKEIGRCNISEFIKSKRENHAR